MHSSGPLRPVLLLKVPGGQGKGAAEAKGQKLPAGHKPPVGPSTGV